MNLKAIYKYIFITSLSVIPFVAHSSVIQCDKLDFKGGIFAYYDMEDDNIQEVDGSYIFQVLTDGLIFNASENSVTVQFLEKAEYKVSEVKYDVSRNPKSRRCQLKFNFSVTDSQTQQSKQVSEFYEIIGLMGGSDVNDKATYWFGQRDTVGDEIYFTLEQVN